MVSSADRIEIAALSGFPLVRPGDDLAGLVIASIERNQIAPADGDIFVIAQKVVSKAEGRHIDLATISPSSRAIEIAARVGKDARLIEAILREAVRVVREAPNVLIVEHRLGLVMANAGIDRSNVDPSQGSEPVLLLPADPDGSAQRLLQALAQRFRRKMAVIISDSFGRPWRRGTVGVALGAAGLPALRDLRGHLDLNRRALRVTETAFADEIAAAASLLMGQSDEGKPAILVRGLSWAEREIPAAQLIRPANEDLFR
jgi:coenzyme F420-0:L-glutamate ligase / coenzyme F420-1:gamma-L-glutamate ligase